MGHDLETVGASARLDTRRRETNPLEYSSLDDRRLVELACEGRQRAFSELLERFQRPVFSLVFRMVRNRDQAEDVAQEAFVKAFNAIQSYDPRYKFSSWLFKIANNVAIDHLRKKELDTVSIDGSPHAMEDEEAERSRITLESTEEDPASYAEARELGGQIEEAIGHLRPEYRTVVLLRHVEGYAYDEIAEVMDLPLGTVKTYLHRARGELKELLAPIAT